MSDEATTGWVLCEHANEVPMRCPCPLTCVCRREGSCTLRDLAQRSSEPRDQLGASRRAAELQARLNVTMYASERATWRKCESWLLDLAGREYASHNDDVARRYRDLASVARGRASEADMRQVEAQRSLEALQAEVEP